MRMTNCITRCKRQSGRVLKTVLLLGVLSLSTAQAAVVQDITGRSVNVPDKVQRVLLGEGRLIYAMSLLEGKQPFSRIVAWQGDFRLLDKQGYAAYRQRFPQIDRIPLIGQVNEASINSEKIISLKPDLAIFSISGHGPGVHNPLVQQLNKLGIAVIFVDFREKPLENTIPSMRAMGQALGRSKQAEDFIAFYQRKLADIKARVARDPATQRPLVFADIRAGSFEQLMSAGHGSFGEMLEVAGGRNLGSALLNVPLGPVSIEHVLMQRPGYYLATGSAAPGDISGVKLGAGISPAQAQSSLKAMGQRDQLKGLSAARGEHRFAAWHMFYVLPQHIVLLEAMAKWLHPDQFRDVDPARSWAQMQQRFKAQMPAGTYWISQP
jgi:iron complex transport system substrate-binding protein